MSSKTKKYSRCDKESESQSINFTASAKDFETSYEESTSTAVSGDDETSTAPYFNGLHYDFHLSLANLNIKETIEKHEHFNQIARKTKYELLQLEALIRPSTFELVQFTAKCFENSQQHEINVDLPNGWKILTTASNSKNGYFGIAYINIKKLQVVIAHHGTENTNEEPYKTHLQTISKRCFMQVSSAVTFAFEVVKKLEEFKRKLPARFQLFFTGHGFGGWLAQIAAFSAQYLVRISDNFLRRENANEGYLVHTEVFDSVGCEHLLIKLVDDLDVRYEDKKINLNNLDITNFVISPNVINCLNKHIGSVVLITKLDSDNFSLTDHYYQDSSSLELILDCLSSSHNMRLVIDWPVNDVLPMGDECATLLLPQFKWLDNCAIPNTKTDAFVSAQEQSQGYFPVRYQTKPFKEDTCDHSVFTLSEQKFLKHFQWIRGFPEYFKPIKLFKDILEQDEIDPNYVLEQLQYLQIKSGKVKSLCNGERNLGQLVSFVKRLLEFYPKLNDEAEKFLTIDEVRKFAYINESIEYSNKLEKLTACFSENCHFSEDVNEFLVGGTQTLHIRTSNDTDTDVVTAMIKNLLKTHEHHLVMRLQNVLALNKSVSLKEVLMPQAFGKVLIVIDFNRIPVYLDEDEVMEFFDEFVGILIDSRVKPNVKLIIISEKRTNFTIYLERLTEKKLQDAANIVDFEGLKWTDLTSNAQEILLSKNLVIFQGSVEEISLKNLLDENDKIQDIIDSSTIISLMKDRLIQIGNQVPVLGKITSCYVPRVFQLEFQVNTNVLSDKKNTRDIIAISGLEIRKNNLEKYFDVKPDIVQMCDENHFNLDRGRIFILSDKYSRENFDQLVARVVSSKNAKNVHWLIFELNVLKWKQTHGCVEYIRQNLNHNEDVATEFEKLYDHTGIGKSQNWEETEMENARKRIKSLVISGTAGMGKTTLLTNLSLKIKSNNPSLWVVRINLSDCTEVLKAVCKDFWPEKFGKPKVLNAVDFLIDKILNCNVNTRLATTLEKNLFKRKLIDTGGVVILIDAFDEICSDYVNVFTKLLSVLMETKVTNIFVASRPFSRDKIEKVLKTHHFVMRQFTMDDQVKFFVNTWQASYDSTNKAKKLINRLKISIEDDEFADAPTKFTGVPLHCRLLAEVYEDTDIINISSNISLVCLYEAFEQKKIEIFENEEHKCTRSDIYFKLALRQLGEFHRNLALDIEYESLDLAPNQMQSFEPEIRKILEVIALKVGLVVRVKNQMQFVHRTYAEFFLAKYFINALEKQCVSESIVQAMMLVMTKDRYNTVLEFFDGCLANLKDYRSVVERFSLVFSKVLLGDFENYSWLTDEVENSFFFRVADFGFKHVFKFFVDCFLNETEDETLVYDMNKDDDRSPTPLVLLALNNHTSDSKDLLDYQLGKIRESSKTFQSLFTLGNILNRKCQQTFFNYMEENAGDFLESVPVLIQDKMNLPTGLFDTAQLGNSKDLQKTLKEAGGEDTHYYSMLAYNEHRVTALNITVWNGRLEGAKFLMEQLPSAVPFIFSQPYNTLLEDELDSGSKEMVQLIASRLSENSHMLKDWKIMTEINDKNRDDILSINTTTVVKLPDMLLIRACS